MSAVFFELPKSEFLNLRQVSYFEAEGADTLLYLDPITHIAREDYRDHTIYSEPSRIPVTEAKMLEIFHEAGVDVVSLRHAGIDRMPVHLVVDNIARVVPSRENTEERRGSHILFKSKDSLDVFETEDVIMGAILLKTGVKVIAPVVAPA